MTTIQLDQTPTANGWVLTAPSATRMSLPSLDENWFEPTMFDSTLTLTGQAQGRGTTYFMQYQQQHIVLRHYRRGGLIGRLVQDSFLFTGLTNTRPYRELQLLEQLAQWGLPSPKPIGGRVNKTGFVWRGDLLSELIPYAQDVHQILLARALSDLEWRHIGATIRRFHDRQVFHHDLNIHNIMLDTDGQAWLIDFDKCGVRKGASWKTANLDRLHRSLLKETGKHPGYHFQQQAWQALLKGYGN